MTANVTVARSGRKVVLVRPRLTADEGAIQRRVGWAWGLLFFNALTFYPGISFLHIPSILGKGIAQASLPFALVVVLTLNRKMVLRPNFFLCLVTLLAFGALLTVISPDHIGTVFRTARLIGYVFCLWLLTPWWGRRDYLLVRCHLRVLFLLLASVLVGLVVAHGRAMAGGRLGGALWPIPATQVAHYAAVATGLVVVLWFSGQVRGKLTAIVVCVTIPMLILTHTRTALFAMIVGIAVAGLSLIVDRQRVRRFFGTVGAMALIAFLTLSGVITAWLARGEGTKELFALTGRTAVWAELVDSPRDKFQEIFGTGLSNSSFNGLPIDSNWLASYQEQGLFGVVICGIMLLFLVVAAYFQPRGVQRALALFLVTYCLLASFTEVGFTDVSPYLLELTLAASLLAPPLNADRVLRRRVRTAGQRRVVVRAADVLAERARTVPALPLSARSTHIADRDLARPGAPAHRVVTVALVPGVEARRPVVEVA
jgi:hypothetical protein